MRRRPLLVPTLLAAVVALAGCSGGAEQSVTPVAAPKTSATTTPAPVPTTTPPATTPPPTTTPPVTTPAAPSYDVVAVQKTLTDLRYYGGAIDGKPGSAMRSALMAFQKVQGLSADGVVGPATLKALAAPKQPALRASAPSNRVEVDLTKQVLYVVKGGAIRRILPVSSGNGASYRQKNGARARSLTPTGWYKIERRIVGERHADLGTLYDPQYFYRGWAIHGSNSVPAYPASHGCVRVTRADAKWLLREINVGTSVYLYGGTHTFSAGSSAPGTDNPSGDTAATTTTTSPAPQPTTSSPTPQPTTSSPTPTPTASTTSPAPPVATP
ncbi:MAG: L,D-transpeptidase family protein [Actinomycetes bacterium]